MLELEAKFVSRIFAFVLFYKHILSKAAPEEYCQWEKFEAECGEGNIVMLQSAFYGRLERGRCVKRDFGYLQCGQDVTSQVDAYCSGRRQCDFQVTTLHGEHGCPTDLTAYLIVDYDCAQVADCDKDTCESSEYLQVPKTAGYLSSTLASQTGCGTARCPWLIEAEAGQRINITLFDFGSTFASDLCHWYFVIHDGKVRKDITRCSDRRLQRLEHIYVSVSNVLRIELFQFESWETAPSFVVRYEAVGCADVMPPGHAEVARRGDQVSVTCLYSSGAWHLTCSKNKWVGKVGTCPGTGEIDPATGRVVSGSDSSPFSGMLLVIGLGVALGIAIGVVLLFLFVMYMRRKPQRDAAKNLPLLRDPNQYRSYLAKSMAPNVHTPSNGNMLAYSSEHDYTSTLHPVPARTLGDTLPPPPPPLQNFGAAAQFHNEPNFTNSTEPLRSEFGAAYRTGAHGSTDSLNSGTTTQNRRFKEHIYEMPKFPDTNRAQSADAAISYSHMNSDGQTSNRTT